MYNFHVFGIISIALSLLGFACLILLEVHLSRKEGKEGLVLPLVLLAATLICAPLATLWATATASIWAKLSPHLGNLLFLPSAPMESVLLQRVPLLIIVTLIACIPALILLLVYLVCRRKNSLDKMRVQD